MVTYLVFGHFLLRIFYSRLWVSCLFFFVLFFFNYKTLAQNNTGYQSVIVGGVKIVIPPVSSGFIVANEKTKKLMEVFVTANYRLICGFVQATDTPFIARDYRDSTKYALVEIPRNLENINFKSTDFEQFIKNYKQSLNDTLLWSTTKEKVQVELNKRMKTFNRDEVNLDVPYQLGIFFSKKDVFANGIMINSKSAKKNKYTAICCILLHVKNRFIILNLYTSYKNIESIEWLCINSKRWTDEILKAN